MGRAVKREIIEGEIALPDVPAAGGGVLPAGFRGNRRDAGGPAMHRHR